MKQKNNFPQPLAPSIKTNLSLVCTIILAYGSRTEQLQQVVSKVLDQGVGHVIIVANAVADKTHQLLTDLKLIYHERLQILSSDENLGSAGGYHFGLSIAIKQPYEYFWLLDDDNLPQEGALSALLAAFFFYQRNIKKKDLTLQSFRESLPEMIDIAENKIQPSLPLPGSFIGFHISNIWKNFYLRSSIKNHKSPSGLSNEGEIIRLYWAPYGGLFFHKDAIETLGLPDPLFFLYADDFAYTLNFTTHGGTLLLVTDSLITDLEPVWNATGKKTSNLYRRLKVLPASKTYYEVRNRIYVGRMLFPGHPVMYFINKWLYIILLGAFSLYYSCWERFKLILIAINDGENGRLGKREFGSD